MKVSKVERISVPLAKEIEFEMSKWKEIGVYKKKTDACNDLVKYIQAGRQAYNKRKEFKML